MTPEIEKAYEVAFHSMRMELPEELFTAGYLAAQAKYQEDVRALRGAVDYAAQVFADYVVIHRAKGSEGADKARRNMCHYEVMKDVLAKTKESV